MKKILASLMVGVVILSGCATSTTSTEQACSSNGDPVIGMVTDTGGINDKSFNQGTWEGIERYCSEFSVGATYQQTTNEAEIEANLENMANVETVEVVVAAGYKFSAAMNTVAMAHPDKEFVLIDAEPVDAEGNVTTPENVHSFLYKEEEVGYLVGYIAAAKSQTGSIGFIGGEPVPAVEKFGYGYIAGAQAFDPEINVKYAYANTFVEAATAKGIADTQIKNGADVIFVAAGGANSGVVQATQEATLAGNLAYTIGVDRDMYEDGLFELDGVEQSTILTSAVKKVDNAAYDGVKMSLTDTWESGTTILGYAEEGVGLPDVNPNLENDQAIIDAAVESLSTTTAIPTTLEAAKALQANVEGL